LISAPLLSNPALEYQAVKYVASGNVRSPENDIPLRRPLKKDSIISTTTMAT
jgi:hypothetical protein